MDDGEGHFTSPEHAFLGGIVLGLAMKHGLDLVPEIDDDGNYLPSYILRDPDLPENVTIRLLIPPQEEAPTEHRGSLSK